MQHDVQWIDNDLHGAGNFLVFNNGVGRPGKAFSSVDEIVPPMIGSGIYEYIPAYPLSWYTDNTYFVKPCMVFRETSRSRPGSIIISLNAR